MSGITILWLKVKSVSDLVKVLLRYAIEGKASIDHHDGRLFILGGLGGGNVVIYYLNADKGGDYIRYNVRTGEWSWVDKIEETAPHIVHIPVVDVENVRISASSMMLFSDDHYELVRSESKLLKWPTVE